MPYDAPAGPMIGLVGRVAARVSPSRLPGKVADLMTPDTSGHTGFGSLASSGLVASLVSRLQTRASGSILWRLTWKVDTTPSQRLIWRLRASPARTSVSDFSGWPTPTTPSGGQTTPPGTSATGRRPDGSKATVTLQGVALMAGWATPQQHDSATPKTAAQLAAIRARFAHPPGFSNLNEQVQFAGWATTTTRDGKDGSFTPNVEINALLGRQAWLAPIGSSAETAPSGRLNPAHSRWLLRLPPAWDDCMVTAMPSTRRRARNS